MEINWKDGTTTKVVDRKIVTIIKDYNKMDYKLIENVEVDGIDTNDYPDFCDAYISSADYDGKPMTCEQLDELNEDRDFIYECVQNQLF